MALAHVYNDRSYEAFGCLFGVRNGSFEPLAARRGFPQDASRAAARAYQWELEDAHSPSWIDWAELEAAEWDEPEAPIAERPTCDDRLTRRQAVRDEDWGDVWTVMRTLAERHGAENVRLVAWFDN
ncbi:hypothetical protein [Streptomyces sp. NBC_01483]|uniref:hypothetical protein n=1 Tax=Streptomyces sp. NBC_01483 TaxID=2903883 RepID=UPI002E345464|nr:hypothetical protein [Streptomyces sp. NBC_01483]